jgi:hypothetical protein
MPSTGTEFVQNTELYMYVYLTSNPGAQGGRPGRGAGEPCRSGQRGAWAACEEGRTDASFVRNGGTRLTLLRCSMTWSTHDVAAPPMLLAAKQPCCSRQGCSCRPLWNSGDAPQDKDLNLVCACCRRGAPQFLVVPTGNSPESGRYGPCSPALLHRH